MKELGTFSEKAHRLVAKAIIDNKIDRVVLVGNQVCFTQESLIKQGFDKNKIFEFKESQDARLKIQDIIYPGDLILIKGSHSMNMNIISKEIAFDPLSIDKI
jgi:UDP-N-acetylmuramoyl-tripeptide--D-alanyl-D-alanine ligase